MTRRNAESDERAPSHACVWDISLVVSSVFEDSTSFYRSAIGAAVDERNRARICGGVARELCANFEILRDRCLGEQALSIWVEHAMCRIGGSLR